jgi:glycerophosphoryl diester phosphodiesterase
MPEFEARRIAHAGGGIDGNVYTNSYEALDFNLERGFAFFEIDFSFTTDRKLVCIHDWRDSYKRAFGLEQAEKPDLATFEFLVDNRSKYRKCTLGGLAEWLELNPSATLVTDVKEHNLKALRLISEEVSDFSTRVIPQVYFPENFGAVKDIGYRSIIWTLYRFHGTDDDVLGWVEKFEGPFAVTMSMAKAQTALPERLSELGIPTYVHTVNRQGVARRFREKYKVTEIYTDFLHPERLE